MRKILVVFVIIVLFIILTDTNDSKEIRIRVIANSNSYVDQEVKMKIVEELSKKSLDINNTETIKREVSRIIKKNNLAYSVSVNIKNHRYKTKYYNSKVYEGGTYKTVEITLGEGCGKNYWSILYPNYYGVSFDDVNTGNVTYKIWIFEKIKELIG